MQDKLKAKNKTYYVTRTHIPRRLLTSDYHYLKQVANGFILLTQIFAISELNR